MFPAWFSLLSSEEVYKQNQNVSPVRPFPIRIDNAMRTATVASVKVVIIIRAKTITIKTTSLCYCRRDQLSSDSSVYIHTQRMRVKIRANVNCRSHYRCCSRNRGGVVKAAGEL